jgi:hypothetical protein
MDSLVRVIVGALWSCATWTPKKIREECSVSSLLICHKLDEISIRSCQAGCRKVLFGELYQDVMEEVKLDPFLVETEK